MKFLKPFANAKGITYWAGAADNAAYTDFSTPLDDT